MKKTVAHTRHFSFSHAPESIQNQFLREIRQSEFIGTMVMDQQPRGATMFPVLKNPVILQIMQEVNVPLSESELTEPGRCKERVREVFVQLVSVVPGRRGSGSRLCLLTRTSSLLYQTTHNHPSPTHPPTPYRTHRRAHTKSSPYAGDSTNPHSSPSPPASSTGNPVYRILTCTTTRCQRLSSSASYRNSFAYAGITSSVSRTSPRRRRSVSGGS